MHWESTDGTAPIDMAYKCWTFHSICKISDSEYDEMAKMLKKDAKIIKQNHLIYMSVLIKSVRAAKEIADSESREFQKKPHSYVEYDPDPKNEMSNPDPNGMTKRFVYAKTHLGFMYSSFGKKLVRTFPKDGNIVQKYLFSTGCSKEECRFILEWGIGRNRETEHFFKGLPPSPPESKPSSLKK
jgi:hypothetical protein